jgi:23S rRNA pseudoU1915 N3-methylase RlmH
MTVKYKDYVKQMYDEYNKLFSDFDKVHAKYVLDKAENQDEYNKKGREVMHVVEEWESRLCSRMEKGKHSSFSHRLADKFKEELRHRFSMIDFIGVEIKKPNQQVAPKKVADDFSLPQIKFN